MTDDRVAEQQSVRRIFIAALAAALVAAAVAFTLELVNNDSRSHGPTGSLLPPTFRQVGFVDHAVRRKQSAGFTADRRSARLQIAAASGPLYVVVRCDAGRIQVETGALTSGQACTGKLVGVVALATLRRATRLDVTVSQPQQRTWAVGIYR
jgi:hypothetical protein